MPEENGYKFYHGDGEDWVAKGESEVSYNLAPGIYEIDENMEGDPCFTLMETEHDELLDLPDGPTEVVEAMLKKFWNADTKKQFKKFGFLYKYGILLHGDPGTGKTSTIFRVAKMVVDLGGIVIYNSHPSCVKDAVEAIRDIEGDKHIMVVYEDLDGWLDRNESLILSLTDGESNIDDVVYIATTNYLHNLPDRIKKRPGRFAAVIEAKVPSPAARKDYLLYKLPKDRHDEIEALVVRTEGFSLDLLKNLILEVYCIGNDLEVVIKKIRTDFSLD